MWETLLIVLPGKIIGRVPYASIVGGECGLRADDWFTTYTASKFRTAAMGEKLNPTCIKSAVNASAYRSETIERT